MVSTSWLSRILALLLCVTIVCGSTGCFAGFNLTKKVYNFNKEVDEDKWIQEFVFLALTIIPIYELSSLADVFIFNSIEFWTGKNVVDGVNEMDGDEG